MERSLTVPARFTELAHIAEFIAQAGREAGLDERTTFHVQMAVDEACSNIIEHAYGGESDEPITVSWHCEGEKFIVTIRDWGKPFDPSAVPEPRLDVPLEELPVGGLGLYIMRKLMDEVTFHFDDVEGNILRMVKRCRR